MALGAISGGFVGPIAVILALVKTSLHQHAQADFSSEDLTLFVERIPIWALAGLLFGAAESIWAGQGSTIDKVDR